MGGGNETKDINKIHLTWSLHARKSFEAKTCSRTCICVSKWCNPRGMDLKRQGAEPVDWVFIYISRGLPWPSSNLPAWSEHLRVASVPWVLPWKASHSLAPLGVAQLAHSDSTHLHDITRGAAGGDSWGLSKLHTCYRPKFCYGCSSHRVIWEKFCSSIVLAQWTQVNFNCVCAVDE